MKTLPSGYGFEIGRSVCDCYLKKIDIKDSGDREYRISFYFLKNNIWIGKHISFGPDQTGQEKVNATAALENVVATYLSGEHLKHIMHKTSAAGTRTRLETIQDALKEKKFWMVPVCLKTLPTTNGGVAIAKYHPFICRQDGSSNWNLYYTNTELNFITKHNHKHEQK